MKITSDQWADYINKLSTLNSRGSKLVQDWIDKHGTEDVDALIDYCYKVIARYGTASAELTASMYEAIAQAEKVFIQPAELADIASYGDAAKAVQGSLIQSPSGQLVKQAVSRQIKLASADTLAKNALRDGAEWAWIPSGDTCPFCLMLASQGWVKASKKALKNGHCKHIHANCDCTYAVRFSHDTDVAGYDPERYLADYEGAEGNKPREKLNAMRRERYEANKGKINAQKRAAYAARKVNINERSYSGGVGSNKTDLDYINSEPYRAKFDSVSDNPALNQSIYKYCKAAVTHHSGGYYEDLSLLRMDGSLYAQTSGRVENTTYYPEDLKSKVLKEKPYSLVSVHNHGTNVPPSGADFGSSGEKRYAFGIVACNNGTVYKYSTRNARPFASNFIDVKVDIYSKPPYNMGVIEAFQCALQDAQKAFGIEWSELK